MQHELKKFLAIIEEGSISKAANRLHISQPALSISLKNLEKQFGVQLIRRDGGEITLTKSGAEVYETARKIELEMRNLSDALELIDSDHVSVLRVGMIDSIASMLLSELDTLSTRVEITIDNSGRLIDLLRQNKLDISFMARPVVSPRGRFTIQDIGNEPFVLVAHPDMFSELTHSIARLQTIPRFLAYNSKSTTHYLMMNFFDEIGLKVESNFSSTSPDLLKLMAINRKGAALLPASIVENEVSNGYLKAYDIFSFARPIVAAHNTSRYIHEPIEDIIKRAKNLLALHNH